MRNSTLKFIVGSICALVVATTALQAQTRKESRTVIINNGDTIVNGKKISELDRSEREKVTKDFENMREHLKESKVEIDGTGIIIERKSNGTDRDILIRRSPQKMAWSHGDTSTIMHFKLDGKGGDFKILSSKGDSLFASVNNDSLRFRVFKPNGIDKDIRIFKRNGDTVFLNDSAMVKRFRYDFETRIPTMRPGHGDIEMPNGIARNHDVLPGAAPRPYGRDRNNSQWFSYSNTDKNGISTRMNIQVSDPSKEDLKTISGSDKPTTLSVQDLTLFPNFSTGKMTLSFNITSKGATEVKILNSDKKTVFTDKPTNFSGNYIKQISLPENGVYYIAVNQNSKWFIKRIVKE